MEAASGGVRVLDDLDHIAAELRIKGECFACGTGWAGGRIFFVGGGQFAATFVAYNGGVVVHMVAHDTFHILGKFLAGYIMLFQFGGESGWGAGDVFLPGGGVVDSAMHSEQGDDFVFDNGGGDDLAAYFVRKIGGSDGDGGLIYAMVLGCAETDSALRALGFSGGFQFRMAFVPEGAPITGRRLLDFHLEGVEMGGD